MTSNGNLGLGLTTPGTTLDVNGAITNRETAVAVAGNAFIIPANVSLVQLTGAATGAVVISAPAAPNPGQRLIVYNNTTGGFGATLNGITIPNDKVLEFVFSNSSWRSTDGGAAGTTPVNIYTADGTLASNRTVIQGANTLAFTGTQTNAFSVDGNTLSVDAANDRVGVGTTTPTNKLVVAGTNAQPSALGTANTNATLRIDGNTSHALDLGTYTNAPFGSYISSQNKASAISLPLVLNPVGGNVGVATSTPQRALHVNGGLQVTNEINVGGNASIAGSAGTAGQVLKSNGPGAAPSWQTLAGVPNATGTVIAVNGQFIVAQEISVQMTSDFTIPGTGPSYPIGNLTNEIIDNENLYTGSATTNSFKVSADGIYLVTMNVQLWVDSDTSGTSPVIGIWDNGTNSWVARVNDYYSAAAKQLQTYTLITSIPMFASTTYSFKGANTQNTIWRSHSLGSTGQGPVTQVSVKRLR